MRRRAKTEHRQEPEPMNAFFDARAEGYDDHMRRSIASFDAFYGAVAEALPKTDRRLRILDLGVGTGLQLTGVFQRLPNASVHGVDVSAGMLRKLEKRSTAAGWDITAQQGSFVDLEIGCGLYDVVISTMALHHQLPEEKLTLYRKIRQALRPQGLFVNGDYAVPRCEAERIRARFLDRMTDCPDCASGTHHLDLPLSVEEEVELCEAAGFASTAVVFEIERAAVIVSQAAVSA